LPVASWHQVSVGNDRDLHTVVSELFFYLLKLYRMADVLTLQGAIEALGQRVALAPPYALLGAPPV
jgi:hypothetical protein